MEWIYLVTILCVFAVQCNAMTQSEIEDFANFLQETSHLDQNLKSKFPEADFDEDEPISDHAWEESGKFEGDLILNDRQRRMIVTNVVEGLARNGLTDSTKRWPNNEVIYFIQREHFNPDQVQAIQDGIDDLARASCVKFTPYKKGDRDAVVIQGSRRGCFSQVGYQGGFQVLNLSGRHPAGRGCFRHGTVVHELLHTLGFYHMQSSPDRDDYIDVVWENIIQATRHNFRKYNSFAVSDFGVGYDYESVLHYSRKAFSVNGKDTLVPKQREADIGQRIGLSQKDTQKLNKMYCDADSDLFLDSESSKPPVVKKETSKNKPFQGRGIGYHQGKAVAINLPAAQTYNLHEFSKIDKLNHFSTAKETDLPPMSIQGLGIAKEINDVMYSGPGNMLNNNINTMKIYSGEDDNENLQGLLHRFSNVIMNSDMNPTDARKFDYDQVNSNEFTTPIKMREAEDTYQPYPSKNSNNNIQGLYSQTSNEDENTYGTKKMYEHTENDSPSYTSSHDQELIHEMQHGYNDKNIVHRHNEGTDKLTSNNLKEYALYNSGRLSNNNYEDDSLRDYVYDKPTSHIHQESENILPSPKIYSQGLQLPYRTNWFTIDSNISRQKPYQQFKSHLDDR